jgi:hypothetical protein
VTITSDRMTPTPPAWLDLDGYCPSAIRDRPAKVTTDLEILLADEHFQSTVREAYEAFVAYEDSTAGFPYSGTGPRSGERSTRRTGFRTR